MASLTAIPMCQPCLALQLQLLVSAADANADALGLAQLSHHSRCGESPPSQCMCLNISSGSTTVCLVLPKIGRSSAVSSSRSSCPARDGSCSNLLSEMC
ncbi:hypothetical protein COO60DRAFT_645150 [Scenedesmus sp. NREL 46B-D3]|nr:hypothetical protein COO60DRAFT_645150 [Scenedesmus sp. NREL 46B-D3]